MTMCYKANKMAACDGNHTKYDGKIVAHIIAFTLTNFKTITSLIQVHLQEKILCKVTLIYFE